MKLELHFKNDISIEKIDLNIIEVILCENNNIINYEFVFNDNINIHTYNPHTINSYLIYELEYYDENLKNKLENLDFIKYVKFNKKFINSNNTKIDINLDDVNTIINDIDNLFYIRKKLYKFSEKISKEYKNEYINELKKLSNLKYDLKRKVFELRIIDSNYEFNQILKTQREYALLLGIDIEFDFVINDVKIEKQLFLKLKDALIDILHNSILSFYEENLKIAKGKYILNLNLKHIDNSLFIEIKQIGRSLNINSILEKSIKSNILKSGYKYNQKEILTSILNVNFINSETDLLLKERIMSLLKLNNIVKSLNGNLEIFNEENEYISYSISIPHEIIFIKGLIFEENNNTYVIDSKNILKVFKFDNKNIKEINSYKYYLYKEESYPYIVLPLDKKMNNDRIGLLINENNSYYILDIDSKMYYEDIYYKYENDSEIFQGKCFLKEVKSAKILNLKSIINKMKG